MYFSTSEHKISEETEEHCVTGVFFSLSVRKNLSNFIFFQKSFMVLELIHLDLIYTSL